MTRTRRAGACAAGVLLGALLCPVAGWAAPMVPDPAATGSAPAPGPSSSISPSETETAPPSEEETRTAPPPEAETRTAPPPAEETGAEAPAAPPVEAPVVSVPPVSYVAAGRPATVPVTIDTPGPYSLAVDPSGLAGLATVDTAAEKPAVNSAPVAAGGADPASAAGHRTRAVLTVRAVPGARLGSTGRLVVTVSGDGFAPVVAETTVTVVPKVALAAAGPAETALSRRAGGAFAASLRVRNTGATVIRAVTLSFPTGPYHRVTGRFANCWYGERTGWCRFDGELRPGTAYALSSPIRMRVRPDFPAPGDLGPLTFRWRIGARTAIPGGAVRGRGPVLRLVPVEDAGGNGSDRSRLKVRVTGTKTANLRALAGTVTGDVGSTVTAVVGVRNIGPVFLRGDRGAPAVVAVTPPPGTTVRSVPRGCAVADRDRRIYHCVPAGVDPFEPGSRLTWRFRLRIDRVDERSGWVGVRASHEEPLLDDNLAPLTVTTASGSGGGAGKDGSGGAAEDHPGLPVTGPPVAALTAIGLLFVASGAAVRRAAR